MIRRSVDLKSQHYNSCNDMTQQAFVVDSTELTVLALEASVALKPERFQTPSVQVNVVVRAAQKLPSVNATRAG